MGPGIMLARGLVKLVPALARLFRLALPWFRFTMLGKHYFWVSKCGYDLSPRVGELVPHNHEGLSRADAARAAKPQKSSFREGEESSAA